MNELLNAWYNGGWGETISIWAGTITFFFAFIVLIFILGKNGNIGLYMFASLLSLAISLLIFSAFMSFWIPALALVIFILALIAKGISKLVN